MCPCSWNSAPSKLTVDSDIVRRIGSTCAQMRLVVQGTKENLRYRWLLIACTRVDSLNNAQQLHRHTRVDSQQGWRMTCKISLVHMATSCPKRHLCQCYHMPSSIQARRFLCQCHRRARLCPQCSKSLPSGLPPWPPHGSGSAKHTSGEKVNKRLQRVLMPLQHPCHRCNERQTATNTHSHTFMHEGIHKARGCETARAAAQGACTFEGRAEGGT